MRLSSLLAIVLALVVHLVGRARSPPASRDPAYTPRAARVCTAPPIRERPFYRPGCIVVSEVTHTSASVRLTPPQVANYSLTVAQLPTVRIPVPHGDRVVLVPGLVPDTDYTLQLRADFVVCVADVATRPHRGRLSNPSFEAVAPPSFLASSFRPGQRDSPRRWTPFYDGGARRVCGVIALEDRQFAYPRSGNCFLALGSLPDRHQFDTAPKHYGVHQAISVHLPAVVVFAWYRTASLRPVSEATSPDDALSMVISWRLDDGTHSDGIVVPLLPVSEWTPVCSVITAPPSRLLNTLHVYFHFHDHEKGAMLIDDASVVPFNESSNLYDRCYSASPPSPVRNVEITSSMPRSIHLSAAIRPEKKQLTIAVPLTADRILRLEAMSRLYAGGPIVAAVVVRDHAEATMFRTIWRRKEWLRSHVDITFLRHNAGPLAINAVRNVAVRMARTDFVVMLDVDMTPATHAFECFRDLHGAFLETLLPPRQKRIVTLPVFITDVHHRSARDKDELLNMLGQRVGSTYCMNSQKSNKIKRWYMSSEASEIRFTTDFEPYGIVRRDLHPAYDERFTGYGFNKIAWALFAEQAGWRMFLLPDHFVTHLNHVENDWVSAINVGHYLQTWRRYLAFVAEMASGVQSSTIPLPNFGGNGDRTFRK